MCRSPGRSRRNLLSYFLAGPDDRPELGDGDHGAHVPVGPSRVAGAARPTVGRVDFFSALPPNGWEFGFVDLSGVRGVAFGDRLAKGVKSDGAAGFGNGPRRPPSSPSA
jgi:hypothetical protein